MSSLVGGERAREVVLRQAHVADPFVADREVVLPLGVVRIGFDQAVGDGTAGLIKSERAREVVLRPAHVADPLIADREVVLPLGIVWFALCQALGDGVPGLVGGKRACEVALLPPHVANSFVAHREVVQPLGVVRIRLDQALGDGMAGLVKGERAREVALRPARVADPLMADREVVQPPGIVWFALCQALRDGVAGLVVSERAREVAQRPAHVADPFVAARLEGFAAPGTVCTTEAVFNQVKNRVNVCFEDLGEQRFKNIDDPVRVFRIAPADASAQDGDLPIPGEELPLPRKPSIAILPFANLSGDPQQNYFADGLRLDIQASLVKASGLFLIAPSTINRYKGTDVPAVQAAREMGVRYILEGAVQSFGNRIRITVELTDVVARQIVWAEHYDRVLDDGLAVQDEITVEVLRALDVRLASGETWILRSTLKNLKALDQFYRGLSHFYAGTKDDNAAARVMFDDVTRLQPDSPVGPAYLCFTHWIDAFRGWTDSKDRSMKQAALWAERAVRFKRTNGLAHIVLASVHLLNRHFDEALADCYKAVELRPNCPTANSYLANILHYCGRSAEAAGRIREAIRITPVYPPWFVTLLAAAYRDSGEIGKSISAAQHGIRMAPGDRDTRLILCSDYSRSGQREQAQRLAQEVVAIDPAFSVAKYAESQPYRDGETLRRLVADLREAGLPE